MLQQAAEHLKRFYGEWNEKDLIYDKWQKDKAKTILKSLENSKQGTPNTHDGEKQLKDKGEPPDGFYFL